MASYLVTGAARGLGFELVTQLSQKPSTEVSLVFATIRTAQPSAALQALIDSSNGRVIPVYMILTQKSSIASGAAQVQQQLGSSRGLDVLINNAGVGLFSPDGIQTMDNLMENLQINVEAPHHVTAAFLPLLRQGRLKKVLNVSSTLGSIAHTRSYSYAPVPAYKISKTALNMLTVQYAIEFEKEGFAFFALSPGYLKTDATGPEADLDVAVGANACLDILARDNEALNGKFLNIRVPGWEDVGGPNQYDGKEVRW